MFFSGGYAAIETTSAVPQMLTPPPGPASEAQSPAAATEVVFPHRRDLRRLCRMGPTIQAISYWHKFRLARHLEHPFRSRIRRSHDHQGHRHSSDDVDLLR